MCWLCIPTRERGTPNLPPSPPNPPLCNASWRSASPRQRTCSASRGQRRFCPPCTALRQARVHLPRSQTTIWKILRQVGCIEQDHRRKPKPLEPRQAGEEVQFDLKDGGQVPADPEGKRQHMVEMANFVD